jgi:hypothetical protein
VLDIHHAASVRLLSIANPIAEASTDESAQQQQQQQQQSSASMVGNTATQINLHTSNNGFTASDQQQSDSHTHEYESTE